MNIDTIIANSYKDFHAKGLHYVCLHRSPTKTVKVYFFEGDCAAAPEVVVPHDHRYNFNTTVLHGEIGNRIFKRAKSGYVMQEFEYRTPLNGGDGFRWKRESFLQDCGTVFVPRGGSYLMYAQEIHTLKVCRPGTILLLEQYEDKPMFYTTAFSDKNIQPDTSGLYEKFKPDEMIERLRFIHNIIRYGNFNNAFEQMAAA